MVRARLGRDAARAADSRHAPGRTRRRGKPHARHRRGSRGAGAALPRRLQRRTRRWVVPRRMDRVAIRRRDLPGISRHQARTRSARPVQSGQDHRSAENGRGRAVPLRPALGAASLSHASADARARLVGLERAERSAQRENLTARQRRRQHRRLRQGRRDVQQQRPVPAIRCRHDVSEFPRHARRRARDARPGQHLATGPLGPTRRRCA